MNIDMNQDELDIVLFAKALADETRQQIMSRLCCVWINVNELVEQLGNVTQPTVSHHLRILREAGLVHTRREGKQIYYSLNQAAVAVCCNRLVLNFAPEKADLVPLTDIPVNE